MKQTTKCWEVTEHDRKLAHMDPRQLALAFYVSDDPQLQADVQQHTDQEKDAA